MDVVAIEAVSNQSFSVQLDGAFFNIRIVETRGVMAADITRNGVAIINGQRIAAETGIVPYPHLMQGNFILSTTNDELVDWRKFGGTQLMMYLTQAEIDALPYLPPED